MSPDLQEVPDYPQDREAAQDIFPSDRPEPGAPTDPMAEWLSLPTLTKRMSEGLADLGVTWESIHRAGGLCWARVSVTGRCFEPSVTGEIAIIQGVWDGPAPSLYAANDLPPADLIAWTLDAPEEWVYRQGGRHLVLGLPRLVYAHEGGPDAPMHRTPLEWLQGGCTGVVLLNWCEWQWGL